MYLETWKLLDIAPTRDKSLIHKAYNRRRKILAGDAFDLSRLLTAYEEAVRAADDPNHPLHQQSLEDEVLRDAMLLEAQFGNKGPSKLRRKLYGIGQAAGILLLAVVIIGYRFYLRGIQPSEDEQSPPVLVRPSEDDFLQLPPNLKVHRGLVFQRHDWIQKGLDAGGDPNARVEGKYPLHIAVEENNLYGARLLLDSGCEVNIVDKRGNTALFRAVENANRVMVKMLLNYGADPNLKNSRGSTALDLAGRYQEKVLYEILKAGT
ncbi:MAG: ankyrin repeat domain-containing protein [Acidobacteriota bacterium]|nr:ankyrin repeat domain-containing protein [Acidobacteriota bacterium]